MSGLTLTTVIDRNSGVGAACGVGVGFWATASCESAAISIKAAQQNARSTVIGVMCLMKVPSFWEKGFGRVCDIDYTSGNVSNYRARDASLARNCSSERSFRLRISASLKRGRNRGHLWGGCYTTREWQSRTSL